MKNCWRSKANLAILPWMVVLIFILACGAAATATPEATAVPQQSPTATAPAAAAATATPAPTAAAADTPSDTEAVVPAGTLNIGQKELGPYQGHPRLAGNPQIFLNQIVSAENLVMHSTKSSSEFLPMLAEEWSISDDNLTWTFKLRKGIPFHGDWGEMTAEDVIWSIDGTINSEKHPGGSDVARVWQNEEGSVETPDPYTIVLNTGKPTVDVLNRIRNPWAGSTWVASKKQSDQLGEEEANRQTALTGPWAFVRAETGSFWRFEAVEDHWRKTPFFKEMVLWEIPEESARVAGFQTGNLDTFTMGFDSIPAIENTAGTEFMSVPGGGESHLGLYGNSYVGIGTPDQRSNYNPDLPWVSANPDTSSEEWQRALKVRKALAISIDRQLIVETLLRGFGAPAVMWGWVGNEDRLEPDMKWEFDPALAEQLLDEAGYTGPDRFTLTLTPSIRGAPSEVEACEAVSTMWRDIGIDVKFQNLPYSTLRPTLIGRTYEGVTCHATSPRVEPFLGYSNWWNSDANWYAGVEHPWLDENMPKAALIFDTEERWKAQIEVGRFLFDNALDIGLYNFDVVWPLSPKVASWKDQIRLGDTRNINGMEWARPR